MTLVALLTSAAPAVAAPAPEPYGKNDAGGIRNVLPPGSNGLANPVELGAFLATGSRPSHNDDQLPLYRDLIKAPKPFSGETLVQHFKDASFGVKPEDVERTYSPRDDVTIVRDKQYGVPHIYGATRDGAMFGIGYASAEDRLFFMDVFRHLGRGQLSSFAGGAKANRAFDALMWSVAPYTEEDLKKQIETRPRGFESEADRLRQDLDHYVQGVNQYIREARSNPLKLPGEYAAINRPQGPDDWQRTDVVAVGAVAGAIFGVGGGEEVESAHALQVAQRRFGRMAGTRVWRQFRMADDPEAHPTVKDKRFPYGLQPRRPRGVALPDYGSVKPTELQQKADAPGESTGRRRAMSNALVVSAAESASGKPLAVFGPQTGYFSPQVLMEQDVHAPGLDARGVAFPGSNLFVQLGRGRDYAWSATTSAQDVVDTFVVPVCDNGNGYEFRGQCRPIERLERSNRWEPNAADSTPEGSETLVAERTALGLVKARATRNGKPVLLTSLRSTYGHETDSGLAFSLFNSPDAIKSPEDFQRAAGLIPFTFNWFYIDSRNIAYQNSGANPVRAARTDPNLPIDSRYEWRGYQPFGSDDPRALTETSTPREFHPNALNPPSLADWNGKQAFGYASADGNWGYGSVYRQQLLEGRVRRLIGGPRKATLPELAEAMADAATVDLRADAVLPYALRILRGTSETGLADAIAKLEAWVKDGGHRIDEDGDGTYEHADAIRILDAWWPLWLEAQFEPVMGEELFDAIERIHPLDNHPNNHGDHVGSAWQDGWYSFAQKDLRRALGRRVRGFWPRRFCGRGGRVRCRRALEASLAAALEEKQPYKDDPLCRDGDQACWDMIWFRPLGGITQPLIPWQNRPTFQQVVEIGG